VADAPHPLGPISRLFFLVLAVLLVVYVLQICLSPAAKRPGAICMPWYRATVFFRQDLPAFAVPNHPEWQNPYAGSRFYESCVAYMGGMSGTQGPTGQ
jgi:hypothetical protein